MPPFLHRLALPLFAPTLSLSFAATLLSDSFDKVSVHGALDSQTASSETNTYRILSGSDLFSSARPVDGRLSLAGAPNSAIHVPFPRHALADPGDSITVTFTVQYPQGAADVAASLRVGLYHFGADLAGARGYDPAQNPEGDRARGYFLVTNPGATKPDGSSLNKDLANQKAPLRGNAVNSGAPGSALWLQSGPGAAFGSSPRVLSLTLTRTAAGIELVGGLSEAPVQGADRSDPWTEFDTVVISNGPAAGAYSIDDLVVTTAKAAASAR